MNHKFIFNITDKRLEDLREISSQTSLNVSELLRRMIDFCSQDKIINQIIPNMSGNILVRK